MRLKIHSTYDVLVLGSGIAGISAALAAAENGASVAMACKGKLFSGSSFYPGTWGLGLIGPADASDEADLADSIKTVGCGMAQENLVEAFVQGIAPAIEKVRRKGVKLRRANSGDQKEFIPCFDRKHRDWNGIEFDSAREIFSRELEQNKTQIFEGFEAVELVKKEGRVCGAVLSNEKELLYVGCKALVLTSGGYGSLFARHLCTNDVAGMGQGLALDAGCRLLNMEFMQVMLGYLAPAYQTVFNEKVYHFTEFLKPDGTPLLNADEQKLLSLRSTHGPFTSRLASKAVDLAIHRASLEYPEGVTARYSAEMKQNPPEFVKTYFDWLQVAKGLTMNDSIQVALFAHAANGGVWIQPDAATGVEGLFAAGEVTGGMHGADRIGGLSTANGLVFGGKAGLSAAKAVKTAGAPPEEIGFSAMGANETEVLFQKLQNCMMQYAMVERSGEGLKTALETVKALRNEMSLKENADVSEITAAKRFLCQLETAEAILKAASLRTESRGSHYRTDYPTENPTLANPICVEKVDGKITARFI